MQPVPATVLSRLDLEQAARQEAGATEALMPTAPGTVQLAQNAAPFASWLAGQLQAGLVPCRGLIVAVAKPDTGIRPVAAWGLAERVTYRALTDLLMSEAKYEGGRSPEAHAEFSYAPLAHALTRGRRPDAPKEQQWPHSAAVQYVVRADVAAFYDYIDHDILARELLLRAADHAAITCLLELLFEVQGRRYGLPQLLEPSDRLSDLYAARILRALRRKQWAAWRYNDDFRIATDTFEDVKRSLDDLAAAARDNGLVLNESKTRTPSFATYWEDNEIPDYDDSADTDPQWAIDVLNATVTPRDLAAGSTATGQIPLHEADRGVIRKIRRALIRLADPPEPQAITVLPKLENIVAFVSSSTPYALAYLQAMAHTNRSAVVTSLTALIADVSLSGWQRLCLLRAIHELGLTDADPFSTWVTDHRAQRYEPAVRAEAALVLAAANKIDAPEVIRALDEEPSALASWYLVALRHLHSHGTVSPEAYDAVRDESGLYAAILARP
ncbi:RNA-directed DNA polymerase [Micromonospora parva]|uniref:RNA-directed DNA polymerase n=1 Tax=Micromonospora parva TaxID=1464048 RepID=A0ABW6VR04_9ACTN|nr:RNA-directed DNA polymerase [Micromonospora parva]